MLLKVTSDALLASDRGLITLLGMLDLSAAFDCVDHEILLTRFERSFGIASSAISWIRSYLQERKQRVRYVGSVSRWSPVLCGVPQGSVLGPQFFICYLSGVFDLVLSHGFRVHGYADDLQIYDHSSEKEIDTLAGRLSHVVAEVNDWMSRNRLRLNTSKTEVILLGSTKRLINCPLKSFVIAGTSIQLAISVRNLGVIFDPTLSFCNHVAKLSSSSYYYIRQLRSIRKSLTVESCHALVRAMVLSRLDYCNGLLYGLPTLLLKQLDGVMRAAARLILQLPRTSKVTAMIHDKLHWLDISARIDYKLCTFAYCCIAGLAPSYLSDLCVLVSSVPGRSHLRSASSWELSIPACRTKTFGPRAFAFSGPYAWNKLPAKLRDLNANSLTSFKKKLKTFLFARMLERT